MRHEKLNTPEHECEPSPDYSFAECVQERLVREVGTYTIIITHLPRKEPNLYSYHQPLVHIPVM